MWLCNRDYQAGGDDFDKMCRFIIEHNADDGSHRDWSLGRLIDWKYGLWHAAKTMPDFFGKNARLWLTQLGDLVGFAVSEDGDDGFQVFADKRYGFLYAEMIAWVRAAWSTRTGSLSSVIADDDARKIEAFEGAGFAPGDRREATMIYDAGSFESPPAALPDGFALLDMAESGDYAGQMRLRHGAFRKSDDLPPAYLLAAGYARTSPIYDARADIILVNAGREPVAGCEGFIDYANGVMEVERVCTRADSRRKGYARLVIAECVSRCRSRDIRLVQISGWNDATIALYSSFGACRRISRAGYSIRA